MKSQGKGSMALRRSPLLPERLSVLDHERLRVQTLPRQEPLLRTSGGDTEKASAVDHPTQVEVRSGPAEHCFDEADSPPPCVPTGGRQSTLWWKGPLRSRAF